MLIGHELPETADVLPHTLIGGVEDVRSIHMHERARLVTFGVAVPADVVTGLEQFDADPRIGEFASHHCSGESCADHCY